jgi:hypothetical protein
MVPLESTVDTSAAVSDPAKQAAAQETRPHETRAPQQRNPPGPSAARPYIQERRTFIEKIRILLETKEESNKNGGGGREGENIYSDETKEGVRKNYIKKLIAKVPADA